MVISRLLPILGDLGAIGLRVLTYRRIHVGTGDLQSGIIHHLLEFHHVYTADLAFLVTGQFQIRVPHFLDLFQSTGYIRIKFLA